MHATLPDRSVASAAMPARAEVEALARDLLGSEGTRLAHVFTAGSVARRLAVLFEDPDDAELLATAATLHDIGYSPRIAHTGFHPLDGGAFLRAHGYPERLACLIAHHSLAIMTAAEHGITDLEQRFPREDGLLADALAYSDMHSAPDGQLIHPERRLADIARRHPGRVEAERAERLRDAIARVREALLAAAPGAARPTARHRPDGPPSTAPNPLRSAFHAWRYCESQYTLAFELYQPGNEDRAAALRLARLRSRADLHRDQYFRSALA